MTFDLWPGCDGGGGVRRRSPPKGAALSRLGHGDQRVGDGGADVGAHDDGDGQLHRQYCQSTVLITDITSPVFGGGGGSDSRPEETMLTTMEEEVDELWTSSVTRMPITSPATGLDRTLLSWKMFPAARPGCVQQKVVQVEPPDGRGLQGVPVRPETLRGTVVTSNELESRGEDVEGADEDVEEGEQQEQLPR